MELVVRHADREERVRVERTGSGYRVVVGQRSYDIDLAQAGPALRSLLIEGRQTEVAVHRRGEGRYWVTSPDHWGEVEVTDPLTHLARESRGGSQAQGVRQVTAYMPGRVVSILVQEGEEVARGQGVVVLEAMKMENEIQAETSGVIRRIFVEAGTAVEAGDLLFEVG